MVTWGWAVVCVGFSLPAGSATPCVNNLHNINSLLVVLGIYFVILSMFICVGITAVGSAF